MKTRVKTKLICLLFFMAMCHITEAQGSLYDPQPYTPVENTPAQEKAKRAALNAFRKKVSANHWDWHQLGYKEEIMAKLFKTKKIKNLSAIENHFNKKDGAWHKSLVMPDKIDFSNKNKKMELVLICQQFILS